jgi:hypothetical protein
MLLLVGVLRHLRRQSRQSMVVVDLDGVGVSEWPSMPEGVFPPAVPPKPASLPDTGATEWSWRMHPFQTEDVFPPAVPPKPTSQRNPAPSRGASSSSGTWEPSLPSSIVRGSEKPLSNAPVTLHPSPQMEAAQNPQEPEVQEKGKQLVMASRDEEDNDPPAYSADGAGR